MNIFTSQTGTSQALHSRNHLNASIQRQLRRGIIKTAGAVFLVLLLLSPAVVQAQFGYTNNGDGTCTITNYSGLGAAGAMVIPTNINGLTVTSIGPSAFDDIASLNSVIIPASVTNIGAYAFENCYNLTTVTLPTNLVSIQRLMFAFCTSLSSITIPTGVTSLKDDVFFACYSLTNITIAGSVTNIGNNAFDTETLTIAYFAGNAPVADSTGLSTTATVPVAYCLPGTSGWSAFSSNTGVPVVLWNPLIQTGGSNFGVKNHHFGFNITNTNNLVVVVEACTNLANPVWTPLTTNTLTNGTFYFSDPEWTNSPNRFYGLGFP